MDAWVKVDNDHHVPVMPHCSLTITISLFPEETDLVPSTSAR